ncbi:hypothetical protein Tco_0865030, partial [Tanacetum coccineum]
HGTGCFKPNGDDGKDGGGTAIRMETSADDRLESDADRSFRSSELNGLIAFDNSQNTRHLPPTTAVHRRGS